MYSPAGLSSKRALTESYADLAKKEVSNKSESVTNLYENENILPIDWSLKTRLRFLSKMPFSCYSGIKSQQESEAILNFSKFNSFFKHLEATKDVKFFKNFFFL